MRFVPIKTVDQQAILTWHSVREGWKEERTALLNRVRGLLAEFGIVVGRSSERLLKALPELPKSPDFPTPCVPCCWRPVSNLPRCTPVWRAVMRRSRLMSETAQRRSAQARTAWRWPRHRKRTGGDGFRRQGLQERPPVWRLARPHAATAQLRRQDSTRTDQLTRQRLSAHPADSRCPQHAAGSDEQGASTGQSITALDHRTLRSARATTRL
jgi:hypothetical protein